MQFTFPESSGYTIYTKTGCKWCVQAKRFFTEAHTVNCDQMLLDDRKAFLVEMDALTGGHRTFPMIFYDNQFIGGYHESIKRVMNDMSF